MKSIQEPSKRTRFPASGSLLRMLSLLQSLNRVVPYLALLLFPVLAYHEVLFTPNTFIPWDLPFYHTPQAVFASESLRSGQMPLWDPNTYCGRPIYAQLQTAYFYPFRILTVLLTPPSPHVTMLRALEIEMILHVFMAGIFTLWLCRRLGMVETSAMLSATAFQLGFFFTSQVQHIGFVEGACWIPLAWLAVILLNERATFARLALLAGTLSLTILSGFAPFTLTAFVTVGIFAVLQALLSRSGQCILLAIGAAITAVLLSAIQILPTFELTFLSIGHLRSTWRGSGGGIPLAALKTLVWPNALGALTGSNLPFEISLSYLYCGIFVLVLATVAVFVKIPRMKFIVLALSVMSLVGMLGDSTPIGKFVYQIMPAFVRGPYYPTSWMPLFSLCVALLSGFGLQYLRFRRRWQYGIILLSAMDLIFFGSGRAMNSTHQYSGDVVLDEAIDGESTALAAMRKAAQSHFPPYRIDGRMDDAWASWTLLTGVPSANGFDPLSEERLLRARQRLHTGGLWAISTIQIVEPKLLSLMNVRYLMSREPLSETELKNSEFSLAAQFPGRYLYENPNVLQRFFFVQTVLPSTGRDESIELMSQKDWDPSRVAIVEGVGFKQDRLAGGAVEVLKYANQEVVLQVQADGQAFMASSELNYPGWVAYLDGMRIPVHYANVAFRGVFVPAGNHQIVYRFQPNLLLDGAWLSLLTLTVLTAGICWQLRRAGFF